MDFLASDSLVPELSPDTWRENVAAVVLDSAGRVLLGLGTGHNAYWHFPQGGVGSSETPEDALRRELQEEVGLAPGSYRFITCYGGLRYRYRKGNDKSGRWRGQEQCYFLVLCHAEMPATDCSGTDEFSALTWVPWRELSADLFAPFKRKVVSNVLAAFFPPHLTEGELMPWLLGSCTPRRYLRAGRTLASCPADDRSLFGGGKAEMVNTLARLHQRLRVAHKTMAAAGRGRLLILLHGAENSGRRQCLRRLAASLDPLHLSTAEADILAPGLPWELLRMLPQRGNISLVIYRPASEPALQDWAARELWFREQGLTLLKLCLHTGSPEESADTLLESTDSAAAPWYIIPSERRWYRDYVVASLVAEALEADSLSPPRVPGV